MRRCLDLVIASVVLAGCVGTPAPRPVEGPKVVAPDLERAACEDGDPLPHVGKADDELLRRPRGAPRLPLSPALLADPPAQFEMPALPEVHEEDPSSVDSLGPIAKIYFAGFRRVSPESLRSAIRLHEGLRPTTEALRRDVKALYATGLFDAIQVNFAGDSVRSELTFLLEERPTRGEVYFRGAAALPIATLREIAAVSEHPSRGAMAVAAARIKARYAEEGRSFAEVSPRMRQRRGEVDVCFRITEGVAVKIERWAFQGNQGVSEAELKAAMVTDKGSVNSVGGVYREDRVALDQMRQLALYYDRGYLEAKIDQPAVVSSEDGARLTITVPIQEGPMYRLGSLEVSGDLVADPARYTALLKSKSGDVFSRSRLVDDLARIRAFHAEAGQPFIEVTPLTELEPSRGVVNLKLEIARRKVIQ